MELHAVGVGGGPAGLSAALTFARMRRSVLAGGAPIGVICTAAGQATGLLCMLGDDVTVFANGISVSDEERSVPRRCIPRTAWPSSSATP
jgi:flavin-dependent dehydrogenase